MNFIDIVQIGNFQVNSDKSKIIVFNSNGRTFLTELTYNNCIIETFTLHFLFLLILMKNVAVYIRPSTNHNSSHNMNTTTTTSTFNDYSEFLYRNTYQL